VKFSSSIEYAIHALVYIAHRNDGTPVLVSEVAKAINVSETYLRKVFQQLTRADLLASHRGVKGGFTISQPAGEITLKDVVEAIDGSLPTYTCLKQQRSCSVSHDCPVQREFARAQQVMAEVLDETSIAELGTELAGSEEDPTWLRVVV
jgi:Rrf2 family protein